ncbi:DUF4328 domain-containing protein [Streptomyces griseofuscus]|uniref:DUF4328 domain-containing protein n=1 Tax=Streptomyces TaxID=1883 RepID=UPI0012FF3636|nr:MULTISPECIES: DUF4328 domain-containing protein [Streptomyces]
MGDGPDDGGVPGLVRPLPSDRRPASPGVVRGSAAWGALARLIPVVGLRAPRPLVQDVLRASTPGAGAAAPARSDTLADVWWGA